MMFSEDHPLMYIIYSDCHLGNVYDLAQYLSMIRYFCDMPKFKWIWI